MKLQTLLCDGVIDNFLPDDNDRGSDPSVVNALHDIVDDFFGAFITPADNTDLPDYQEAYDTAKEKLFSNQDGEISIDLFIHYVESTTSDDKKIDIDNDDNWAQIAAKKGWFSSRRPASKRTDIKFMNKSLLETPRNLYHMLYAYSGSVTPPNATQKLLQNQHFSEIVQPPIPYKMTTDDIDNMNASLNFDIDDSDLNNLKDGYEQPLDFYSLHKCAHEMLQAEYLSDEIIKIDKNIERLKNGSFIMERITNMCEKRLKELKNAIDDEACYNKYLDENL